MRLNKKHSLALRWTHWINFPALALMVWSGWRIYWANPIYTPFLPQKFYEVLGLNFHLADGMAFHFSVGWFFVVNAVAYAIFLAVSGHWRVLWPGRRDLANLGPTLKHELVGGPAPEKFGIFNAAQKISYVGVLLIGLIEILTGFAIYKPVQLRWLLSLFGGYEGARLVHFIGMVLLLLFFVVHVVQVARSGFNNFRSIVTGFEVSDDAE